MQCWEVFEKESEDEAQQEVDSSAEPHKEKRGARGGQEEEDGGAEGKEAEGTRRRSRHRRGVFADHLRCVVLLDHCKEIADVCLRS